MTMRLVRLGESAVERPRRRTSAVAADLIDSDIADGSDRYDAAVLSAPASRRRAAADAVV